jgi:hypothetical protein
MEFGYENLHLWVPFHQRNFNLLTQKKITIKRFSFSTRTSTRRLKTNKKNKESIQGSKIHLES